MCKFFSCISDGKGKTLFFTIEQVAKIMAEGNKNNYDFNSHTSIAHFNGIEGLEEDKWNKWEYDVARTKLNIDELHTTDDSEKVKVAIEKYIDGKDVAYLNNLYNRNSGNRNSGNWNSGDRNTGNRNSGNCNSGNWNSGDRNSGNWNSGNWNSGDRNSGNGNSGIVIGNFNSKDIFYLFNQPCKKQEWEKANEVMYAIPFTLAEWVYSSQMTEEEKQQYPNHAVCDGFLRTYDYKKAWEIALGKVSMDVIQAIRKLKNFNNKVFMEITGVDLRKYK